MIKKFLAISVVTGILALSLPAYSGVNTAAPVTSSTSQLSERETEFLATLRSASAIERRAGMVYLAGKAGATQLIEVAIQQGLTSPDTMLEYTLLTAAATNGQLETVKMLLALGADIELKDESQDTAYTAEQCYVRRASRHY